VESTAGMGAPPPGPTSEFICYGNIGQINVVRGCCVQYRSNGEAEQTERATKKLAFLWRSRSSLAGSFDSATAAFRFFASLAARFLFSELIF